MDSLCEVEGGGLVVDPACYVSTSGWYLGNEKARKMGRDKLT